jgi:hypothetical protein
MVSCLAAAMYVFKVDIMEDTEEYNEELGTPVSQGFTKLKTVRGYVFPYLDGGVRGAGTTERFGEEYVNLDYLRIKTSVELSKRWRVTNIRNAKTGRVVYQEQIGGDPTVYQVDGSAPIVNTLTGNVDEWLSTLSRAEVQA